MESAPRYEILDTIAAGDFATVYRARDRDLGREVAIKQIHRQFLERSAATRAVLARGPASGFPSAPEHPHDLRHRPVPRLADRGTDAGQPEAERRDRDRWTSISSAAPSCAP